LAETLEPGASMSMVARRHDVNANMLFTWRRQTERLLREEAKASCDEWATRKIGADALAKAWKEEVVEAASAGRPAPPKPAGADAGPEPWMPRLVLSDVTRECPEFRVRGAG
jgi:transposase